MPATERRPKRVCQVCLQYDDHPRIELLVTTEGPLGLHTPGEVRQVAALLGPHMPANSDAVDAAVAGKTPAQAEDVYRALIPDLDERDAYKAWRAFLHDNDFGAHMDCYVDAVPEDHKPQLAVDAFDDDGNQTSWEDRRKIMPSKHALEQVGKLKGDALRAHLVKEPAGVDHGHGSKR